MPSAELRGPAAPSRFSNRYPRAGFRPIWIKPRAGYIGNHIVASDGEVAFDYHGYSRLEALLAHTEAKAGRWWPGWSADLFELPADVLVSEQKSRTYDGLWLREPRQYLHDALPRAHAFLARFRAPVKMAQHQRYPLSLLQGEKERRRHAHLTCDVALPIRIDDDVHEPAGPRLDGFQGVVHARRADRVAAPAGTDPARRCPPSRPSAGLRRW